MGFDKTGLPPYSAVVDQPPPPAPWARRHIRRSRAVRIVILACVAFIVYAQWTQIPSAARRAANANNLSIEKLQDDMATCSKLHRKPQDPIGLGRERNARYIDGHKPTLIRNATVWVGEPAAGTAAVDARAGKGFSWITADVLLEYGLIQKVEKDISLKTIPKDTLIWNAQGRQLTTGVIDMHSHAGVDSLPDLVGNSDTNELSADITPYVRSIDGIQPFDQQIQVIKSGGVTTSLVLPGSGNNIGGEAYVIKHAVGKPDGRSEVSAEDMLADPDRNWRYMKMACGENAKRVYGKVGEHGPFSRLGESYEFRHAFEQAANLIRVQDDWCNVAATIGVENMQTYLPQEIKWEALGAALRGQVHINTHCYTVPDLEAFVDHTNEFKFPIRAFHHAHQTYLVPEILKRAWGGVAPASAIFATNMYYKAESYIGSEYAGKTLWEAGLLPVYVSDNPVLNAQHVIFEAAKGYKFGLPYHAALASVTSFPAELLGLGQRLGKIKPGYDADIVVWDSDPLSVGATPVQVWIDGTAQYEDPIELEKPLTSPITPNLNLNSTNDEPHSCTDAIFTGITRILLSDRDEAVEADGSRFNVAVKKGKITCIGSCANEISVAQRSNIQTIQLDNGYITESFTAFGSTLGLNEIDAETITDNGPNTNVFSRALEGLALDTKKLKVANAFGITKAISAPKFTGGGTHHGTSVGFLTGAINVLDDGAVFANDVAVHYTLTPSAKREGTPSLSSVVGSLRHKLLEAVTSNETISDPYSEKAYLRRVVDGEIPLALTIHSADMIAAVLKVKELVESEASTRSFGPKIRLIIIGGAESYGVAKELAAAEVGVVLAPFQSYATSWDQRRALSGAPLTNGTAIDLLLDAGVVTAIGLEEDWIIRDLALLAGKAYKNGGGRLSEKGALALISSNIYKMLGVSEPKALDGTGHFVVFEGSPFDIDSRIKAVGGDGARISVF
ncbi:putative carbohydrate esterase family 9 protein [Phaeoacremonium minimum UCRPA7]|uniref:Putative carbohydrate esterase family 9 protein n=1 Tax=Phaeoacremonium minimum (strain UCR-PA7) TaxID=1286976 RepID=R8BCQ7_PHAM7|nr:putative carbohydrate esterase family 9 protein [Phaeoacremonium minimum UCRPA7]EON97072.1 putative carbohydrate esterase family 9 protein [Phaeoacremonium minimum UCRPA7]